MKLDFYTVVWFFRACPSPTFCWVPHDDSIPQQLLPTQALHAALTSQTLPHTVIRPCRGWEASFVITFTSALWVAIKSHVVPGHSVMSLWALGITSALRFKVVVPHRGQTILLSLFLIYHQNEFHWDCKLHAVRALGLLTDWCSQRLAEYIVSTLYIFIQWLTDWVNEWKILTGNSCNHKKYTHIPQSPGTWRKTRQSPANELNNYKYT